MNLRAADPISEGISISSHFLHELCAHLFTREECVEIDDVYQHLTCCVLAGIEKTDRRATLCADGTPIEISLALDNLGRFAIRFVCDAVDCALSPEDLRARLMQATAAVVPRRWPSSRIADYLTNEHLRGIPEQLRFRMWHGAGFAPVHFRVAKLYFNTEWMPADRLTTVLRQFLSAKELEAVDRIECAGVGYDLTAHGLHKVKLYHRCNGTNLAELAESSRAFLGTRGDAFEHLLRTALARDGLIDHCITSTGFLLLSGAREFKTYIQFRTLGIETFSEARPALERILSAWELPLPGCLFGEGPSCFSPTLLAVGIDADREMASLYFKP